MYGSFRLEQWNINAFVIWPQVARDVLLLGKLLSVSRAYLQRERRRLLFNKYLTMVETSAANQITGCDVQTQFGNGRQLDVSDCIFVFKDTQSDYEEPLSDVDNEVFIVLFFFI